MNIYDIKEDWDKVKQRWPGADSSDGAKGGQNQFPGFASQVNVIDIQWKHYVDQ